MRELARLVVADTHQAVPVEGGEAGTLPDRYVQRRDVRVADERLRVGGDEIEVEIGDHLARTEPALERLDDVHFGVGEERVQVVGPAARVAGDVVVTRVDTWRELHAVTAALPPLHAALDPRAHVVGAGERADADRAAVLKRFHALLSTPARVSATSDPIVARS